MKLHILGVPMNKLGNWLIDCLTRFPSELTYYVAYTCSLFFLLLFVAFHRIYMFVCFCLLPLVGE